VDICELKRLFKFQNAEDAEINLCFCGEKQIYTEGWFWKFSWGFTTTV
jgi:hypothetical protein